MPNTLESNGAYDKDIRKIKQLYWDQTAEILIRHDLTADDSAIHAEKLEDLLQMLNKINEKQFAYPLTLLKQK